MRVFSRSTILRFSGFHPSAREPLRAWFAEVSRAQWSGPVDIKRGFASASFLPGDRVVFNIKGNTYRVVVAVKYEFHAVYVRFIGTHAEYDRIDATKIGSEATMNVRPIRNAKDHGRALREIERLWQARAGTPEGDRFEVLSTLVDAYERAAFPIDPPDPIQAIRFRVEQGQVGAPELIAIFGTRARCSEILGKRRRLTLPMIRALHAKLGIPLESLVRDYRLRASTTTKRAA